MHPAPLNNAAKRENAMTLADALGVSTRAAATMLDACIVVTTTVSDRKAIAVADDVARLLSRTVSGVERRSLGSAINGDAATSDTVAVEVVLGGASPTTHGPVVRVRMSTDALIIERTTAQEPTASTVVDDFCTTVPALLGRLSACYIASAAVASLLGANGIMAMPNPFTLHFSQLGVTFDQLRMRIDLGRAYLAGAGAIGNAVLWAAEHVDLHGELDVVDDDVVGDGNLNRQILFESDDIGLPKAERLVDRASMLTPHLRLRARTVRLQKLDERSEGPWLRRLIVAVDSRRARRALQKELPGEVFDASTTDIREVVVHHNKQPTAAACMACIYMPDKEEYTREHHIAEVLGVAVDEVRAERISAEVASRISSRYPELSASNIEGIAYDTLFKQLCGEGQLQTQSGKRVLAPFAFVSCLAGVLLVVELVRRLAPGGQTPIDNYWRASAWHPPLARRRENRVRELKCEVCSNAILSEVIVQLWGDQSR